MIPARTLRVASVPRICIWSGILLARHSSPPFAAFFSLPFSLVSYRCLPALFKYGGHAGDCDRSSRHGGCERREAHENLEEGFYQAALILTVLVNRLNDNDRRRPSRGIARRFSTILTPRTDLSLFHSSSIFRPVLKPKGCSIGFRPGGTT